MKEVYRSAASILLLRPTPEPLASQSDYGFQILLLHKPRKRDAWQLPQGGREEGETIEQAALRELHEEAGITDVRVLSASKDVYQYDFPASFRRFRPDYVKGQKIEFIVAIVTCEVQVTLDEKEVNKYVWITPDQLPQYIKRKEYLELLEQLMVLALEEIEKTKSL